MIVIPPQDPNERRADPAEDALGQLYEQFTNVQNLAEFHAALRKRDALYALQHQEMGENPQDFENLHPRDFYRQFDGRADEDDKAVVLEAPYRIREQLRDALSAERNTAKSRVLETYKKLFIDHQLGKLDTDRMYYLGKIADAANDQDRERYITALIGRLKLSGDAGLLYKDDTDRLIENIPSDLDIFSFNREYAADPARAQRLLLNGAYPNMRPELRESLLKEAEKSISNLELAPDQAESGDSRPNGARAADYNLILPVWRIPPEGLPDPKGLEQTLPYTPIEGLDPAGLLMLVNATDSGSNNSEAPKSNVTIENDGDAGDVEPDYRPGDLAAASQTNASPQKGPTNSTEAPPPRAVRAHHVLLRPNDRVVTIEYDNGPDEIRWGGSRTWRNHNPGNLVPGDLATFEGAIGRDDGFAIFPDDETGLEAMYGLVYEMRDEGRTVDRAIERWAPPGQNNTPRYKAHVHSRTGLTGKERLIDLSDAQIDSFVNAIRREEGWTPGHVAYDE
ncbi:MAG TPA: hypothetical protein VGH16_16280 [Candidatus Binatia bacterium]